MVGGAAAARLAPVLPHEPAPARGDVASFRYPAIRKLAIAAPAGQWLRALWQRKARCFACQVAGPSESPRFTARALRGDDGNGAIVRCVRIVILDRRRFPVPEAQESRE